MAHAGQSLASRRRRRRAVGRAGTICLAPCRWDAGAWSGGRRGIKFTACGSAGQPLPTCSTRICASAGLPPAPAPNLKLRWQVQLLSLARPRAVNKISRRHPPLPFKLHFDQFEQDPTAADDQQLVFLRQQFPRRARGTCFIRSRLRPPYLQLLPAKAAVRARPR